MTGKGIIKRVSLGAIMAFVFVGASTATTYAHVTVKPGEVTTSTYQTFTISVPNEKEIPTTGVKIVIPANISNVTPTQKAGWEIITEKEGDVLTSIAWNGGSVGVGVRDEFTFTAKTPEQPSSVQWKAYQTYADGTVVSWDQTEATDGHGDEAKGPASVMSVVTEPSEQAAANQQVTQATSRANRALYISIAAVVVALIAVFFATRNKQGK